MRGTSDIAGLRSEPLDQLSDLRTTLLEIDNPTEDLFGIKVPEVDHVGLVTKMRSILRQLRENTGRLSDRLPAGRLAERRPSIILRIIVLVSGTPRHRLDTVLRVNLIGLAPLRSGVPLLGDTDAANRFVSSLRTTSIAHPLLAYLHNEAGTAADMVGDQLRRNIRCAVQRKADGTASLGTAEAAAMLRVGAQLEPEGVVRPTFMNIGLDMGTPRGEMGSHAMEAIGQVQLAGTAEHGNRRELPTLFEKIRVVGDGVRRDLQADVGRASRVEVSKGKVLLLGRR